MPHRIEYPVLNDTVSSKLHLGLAAAVHSMASMLDVFICSALHIALGSVRNGVCVLLSFGDLNCIAVGSMPM